MSSGTYNQVPGAPDGETKADVGEREQELRIAPKEGLAIRTVPSYHLELKVVTEIRFTKQAS